MVTISSIISKSRIIVLWCLLLLGSAEVQAQSEPIYSQYMFNPLNINPAFAGSRGVTSGTMLIRNQWEGIKGAPQTSLLSTEMLLNEGRIGLGIQVMDDRIGIERTSGVLANYSFRIATSERGVLSLGLRGGLLNYRANFTEINTFDPSDPTFGQNVNGFLPAAGAGIYYSTDKFYAGFSVPSLLSTKLSATQRADVGSGSLRNLHMFYMMGFVVDLSDDVVLKPSMLVKRVNAAPVQVDLNANIWFKEIFSVGASYRSGDAVVGMLEYQISPKFRAGYAYDYTISNLRSYNLGTHELMLRFELPTKSSSIVSNRNF